jgi:predicted enzyme involved in methoxymalonyl-ACP biosynthesis
LRTQRTSGAGDFFVSYRPTPRNAGVAKVFDDLGFERLSEEDGVSVLVFPAAREIPESHIVTIVQQPNT